MKQFFNFKLSGPIFFAALFFSISSPLAASQSSREIFVDPIQAPLPFDGGLKEGQVALTFDDGPYPETTRKILKTLKKYNVKAVFFQVGRMVQGAPEVTREILDQGHTLGSHSWDHPDLATMPLKDAIENIKRGHAAVEVAVGDSFILHFFDFLGSLQHPI